MKVYLSLRGENGVYFLPPKIPYPHLLNPQLNTYTAYTLFHQIHIIYGYTQLIYTTFLPCFIKFIKPKPIYKLDPFELAKRIYTHHIYTHNIYTHKLDPFKPKRIYIHNIYTYTTYIHIYTQHIYTYKLDPFEPKHSIYTYTTYIYTQHIYPLKPNLIYTQHI